MEQDHRKQGVLRRENGFVLVVAMMILVVLSVLGVSALNTTMFELLVAGNERQEKQLFYGAESGCRRGGQWLRNLQLDQVENYADTDLISQYVEGGNFSSKMKIRDVDASEETNLNADGSYPVTFTYQVTQAEDAAGNLRQCRPIPGNNPNILACFYEVQCNGANGRGGRRVIRVVINKPTDFR